MEILTYLLIAVGLAMDAFAVSLGIGTTNRAADPRAKFRLSFHFGVFQAGMTVLGWLAGSTVAGFINGFDHWIALILLSYVGANMIRSGFNSQQEIYASDPSRGRILMMLCVATSLDALAVGLSMAIVKAPIIYPSLVIGVVASGLSLVGLFMGCRLGELFGKRMEILGGLLLIAIGLEIVINHLFVL